MKTQDMKDSIATKYEKFLLENRPDLKPYMIWEPDRHGIIDEMTLRLEIPSLSPFMGSLYAMIDYWSNDRWEIIVGNDFFHHHFMFFEEYNTQSEVFQETLSYLSEIEQEKTIFGCYFQGEQWIKCLSLSPKRINSLFLVSESLKKKTTLLKTCSWQGTYDCEYSRDVLKIEKKSDNNHKSEIMVNLSFKE